ncbi:MAG: hypothetical protein KBA66_09895 [Leptospiraceae bacterium]|nr:hypothetical protein [Leptospiraceae bacterium]
MYYHLEKEILKLPINEQFELLERIIHNLKTAGVSSSVNKIDTEKKIKLRTYQVSLSNPNLTFSRSEIYGDYGR